MDKLTAQRLREVVSYDPSTGVFTRLVRTAQRHQVGDRADLPCGGGYRRIAIDSIKIQAHRAAWLYVHGEFPSGQIDHINGVRDDNRLANLRDVTPAINSQNQRGPRRDNKSGFLGVVWFAPTSQWRARIHFKGKGRHLGLYPTAEEAHRAYLSEKRKLHEGCTL
jgi:hypothetical protein